MPKKLHRHHTIDYNKPLYIELKFGEILKGGSLKLGVLVEAEGLQCRYCGYKANYEVKKASELFLPIQIQMKPHFPLKKNVKIVKKTHGGNLVIKVLDLMV